MQVIGSIAFGDATLAGFHLPVVMRALHGHDICAENVPAHWSWAAHLVFGLSFALYPRTAAWLTARRSRGS